MLVEVEQETRTVQDEGIVVSTVMCVMASQQYLAHSQRLAIGAAVGVS
jgi:hypothetical protein